MTINQAVDFFENVPQILQRDPKALRNVGLGYIQVRTGSTSLSGGESQRVKLATNLSKSVIRAKTLIFSMNRTTGLHFGCIRIPDGCTQKPLVSERGNYGYHHRAQSSMSKLRRLAKIGHGSERWTEAASALFAGGTRRNGEKRYTYVPDHVKEWSETSNKFQDRNEDCKKKKIPNLLSQTGWGIFISTLKKYDDSMVALGETPNGP